MAPFIYVYVHVCVCGCEQGTAAHVPPTFSGLSFLTKIGKETSASPGGAARQVRSMRLGNMHLGAVSTCVYHTGITLNSVKVLAVVRGIKHEITQPRGVGRTYRGDQCRRTFRKHGQCFEAVSKLQ